MGLHIHIQLRTCTSPICVENASNTQIPFQLEFKMANLSSVNSQVHDLQKLKKISLKAVNYFCKKTKSNLPE